MARSYAGLANMAVKFGFRLAKAREGSQHLGMPVRYLLENGNGALPFRSLGDVERKLSTDGARASQAQSNDPSRALSTIPSEPTWPSSFSRNAWGPTWAETRFQTPAEEVGGPLRGLVSFFGGIAEISAVAP